MDERCVALTQALTQALGQALRNALSQAGAHRGAVPSDGAPATLPAVWQAWHGALLQPLPDQGLAHSHVRLAGCGALARIPKHSQMNLAPADNLRYQAACFVRASAGGHAPRLLGVLPPSPDLPCGALIVEEVVGRPAALPQDLPALAQALASIHRLSLPPPAAQPPLQAAGDPLAALRDEIDAQAVYLPQAGLAPPVQRQIAAALARWRALVSQPARPPSCLIAFDAHPGNFIVRADTSAGGGNDRRQEGGEDSDSTAVLVDLEKCRYSAAPLDLAHATLYTSTTWDVASRAVLTADQVLHAYTAWAQAAGPAMAQALQPWHLPLRRAMWLWSITWCAKWRATSVAAAQAAPVGEDWSAALSSATLVEHVRGRVDHYLSTAGVGWVLAEFDALEGAWGDCG
jgi:hypothetical protein